ncbi:MAG TPA: ISAs1 family transposase [Candidatus Limnocylindrales bacterium]|nr:ISAs1 family transposase [Candidatus Limnocylindrales bacterium]
MHRQYIVLPEGLSFSSVFSVKPEPVTSLWYFLHEVTDPRRAQGRRHALPVLLLLALLALCSGHTSYQAMEEWARNYQHLLREQLPFLSGHTPDAATFHRVFARLDTEAFEDVLGAWLQAIVPQEKGEGIALDGKTISRTGVHLVAAFTHTMQSVLFEQGTEMKGKELVVGPAVLAHIPLKDHIVTGDAMFAQRKICEQIVTAEGGYVFTVKGNQEKLEQDIRLYFQDLPFQAPLTTNRMVTYWKGRKEKRIMRMSDDPHLLSYLQWPGVTHVWECTREVKRKGETTREVAVGIASFPQGLAKLATTEHLNQYLRGHWGIENALHRTRDVSFNEDKATIRKGKAPQIMAALKNLVISILHRGTVRSFPTAFRQFAAHPEELFSFLGLPEVAKATVLA